MTESMETKDIVLTPEMKDKLKGFMAFTVETNFIYVPKVYRDPKNGIPKELWPVFTLKSKDGIEVAEAEDQAGYFEVGEKGKNNSKYKMETGMARINTLRDGIIAVKNLPLDGEKFISFDKKSKTLTIKDADGKEHPHNKDVNALIRHLTSDMQVELQEAINERSTLTEEELSGLI